MTTNLMVIVIHSKQQNHRHNQKITLHYKFIVPNKYLKLHCSKKSLVLWTEKHVCTATIFYNELPKPWQISWRLQGNNTWILSHLHCQVREDNK